MASGRPDWHSIVTITGKYNDDFKPVLVDELGQLYIVMTGQELITGDPQNIAVDGSGIILARLKGHDGTNLQDVKVDTAGNILARMTVFDGTDPVDIKVDTDGYLLARMKGHDGSDLQDIKTDTAGHMLAVMKGTFSGALQTIALDKNFAMQATMVFGDVSVVKDGDEETSQGPHWYCSETGRGRILGGYLNIKGRAIGTTSAFLLSIDGDAVEDVLLPEALLRGFEKPGSWPFVLTQYDDIDFDYGIVLAPGMGFDQSFSVGFNNQTGQWLDWDIRVVYERFP